MSVRSLIANTAPFIQIARCKFSTGPKALSTKVYELRVYNLYSKDVKKTYKSFEDYIHFRMKHSKLFGFWSAELGTNIFQAVHLWEYDSLSHRSEVRKGLLQDADWQGKFMQPFLPTVQTMFNALLVPARGSQINTNFKNDQAAAYELQSLEPGEKDPVSAGKGEILVGRFTGIFDSPRKEYRLWRYTDVDAALAGSWNRSEGAGESAKLLLHKTIT